MLILHYYLILEFNNVMKKKIKATIKNTYEPTHQDKAHKKI